MAKHPYVSVRGVLAAALLMISALACAHPAELREETGFGSNPGNLRMFSYVPANQEPAAPLIVVLHGSRRSPERALGERSGALGSPNRAYGAPSRANECVGLAC